MLSELFSLPPCKTPAYMDMEPVGEHPLRPIRNMLGNSQERKQKNMNLERAKKLGKEYIKEKGVNL